MNSFEDMPAWQKAMNLAEAVHGITSSLPRSEDYGLTSQMRRSAVSITDNIAEGFGRETVKDKCHFYTISRGSAFELKNQHIYGNRVGYFDGAIADRHKTICEDIVHELNLIMKALRKEG